MKHDEQMRAGAEREIDPRIDLAVERTTLAMERTQLAWVRTVMALITAGIAIDRGMAALHEARLATGEAWLKNGHFAGLLLTGSGTLLMALVTIYYKIRVGELRQMQGKPKKLLDPGLLISLLITLVGILGVYFLNMS